MKITRDNINDLEIGQQIFEAHWGFRMIGKTIYLGVHETCPIIKSKKHIFFNNSNSFSIYADMKNVSRSGLHEKIRDEALYTTYEEACTKSREWALACIDHYNSHDFKENPIIVKEN